MMKLPCSLFQTLILVCGLLGAGMAHGDPQSPANPPDLAVSNITQNSAQVTWESIPEATRYELAYGTDNKASNRPALFLTGVSTTLNNLVPNTIYRIRVRAIVGGQAGEWSRVMEFSTQIPAMTDLIVENVRNASIHLTWSGRYTDLPDISYEISYGSDPDATSDGSRLTDRTFITLQNLIPETRYYIKMRVRNPKAVGPWSAPISCTTLPYSPDLSPRGLTVRNTEASAVQVEWQPVSQASNYDLAYGTDPGAESMGIMPVERNSFTLHLSPNSRYFFKVRSVTHGSTGPWSGVVSLLTLPARPRGLNASSVTAQQAIIEWQSLSGTQMARYYHFSWGTDSAGTNLGTTVTATASYTLNNLAPNQVYAVRARTVNESGSSAWSDPFTFTTLPAGFSKVEIIDIRHASAKVRWPLQAQATGYEVSYSLDREGNFQSLGDIQRPPVELKNLRPDTAYYVKVRPILAQDRQAGAWSNVVSFSTFPTPMVPENLAVRETGGTYARVSWTAVDKISTYELMVATEELSEDGRINLFNQSDVRVTSLEGNTRYFIKVRARNLGGPGAWSQPAEFTTLPSIAPRNLAVSNVTPTEAFVSWEVMPGTIQATYQVRYATLGGEWKTLSNHAARTVNLTNLKPDEDFRLQVRGQNSAGYGPWTEEISFKTPPSPPSIMPADLAAKYVDDVSAVVAWKPISQPVQGYHVSMGTDADASNRGFETVRKPEFALKGLSPETAYFIKVRAYSASGEGPWSDTLLVRTRPTPPITAPTNVKITDVTDDSLMLSWDRAPEAVNYEASIGTDPQGENLGSPQSVQYYSHAFTKLKPGVTYRVKVRSVNRGGAGPWSQALEITTRQP